MNHDCRDEPNIRF